MKIYGSVDNLSTDFIKKNLSKKNSKLDTKNKYKLEDSVELSSELTNIKKLEDNTLKTDSIRNGKVNGIKLQIEKGSYKISSEKIADKIIEEHIIK
jgi:flagellar biosynthesis anti-sigma factor FlgM